MQCKKITACIALTTILLGSHGSLLVANGQNEMERKRDEIKKQNDELSKSIGDTKSEIEKQKAKKIEIDNKISEIQIKIDKSLQQISSLDADAIEKTNHIKEIEKEIEKNREIFVKGANIIFRTGGEVSILNILLNCSNVNDLISAFHLIKSLSERQEKAIKTLNESSEVLVKEQNALQEKREAVAFEKQQLETQKTELYELIEESQKLIQELNVKQDEQTQRLDLNSAEIKSLDNKIVEYYAKQEQERKEREEREAAQRKSGAENKDNSQSYSSKGGYVWPTPGFTTLTSQYNEDRGSYHHLAIDIGGYNIYGSKIHAAQAGTVIDVCNSCNHYSAFCSCGGGYGNYVIIDHGGGRSTLYAHQLNVFVRPGQKVERGEVIGIVGSTGHSSGPHLHYETRRYVNGRIERYNPMSEYR